MFSSRASREAAEIGWQVFEAPKRENGNQVNMVGSAVFNAQGSVICVLMVRRRRTSACGRIGGGGVRAAMVRSGQMRCRVRVGNVAVWRQ